ncbi:hypothetical protein EWM64_g7816 [Hericium alpestre]|uniref:Uncharacterized protein n=1 Tax=Hericium alpestre TaxID=135208 RepID=A0A4Y9ZNK7_9AGAM|nr:hypothetical protein EWM64_g7816 [Hericium alpestre]
MIFCPVTYAPARVASHKNTPAMSSSPPFRRIGTILATRSGWPTASGFETSFIPDGNVPGAIVLTRTPRGIRLSTTHQTEDDDDAYKWREGRTAGHVRVLPHIGAELLMRTTHPRPSAAPPSAAAASSRGRKAAVTAPGAQVFVRKTPVQPAGS